MKRSRSITIKDSVIIGGRTSEGFKDKNTPQFMSDIEEAERGIELLRQLKSSKREDVAGYQQIEYEAKIAEAKIEKIRTKQNTGNLPIIKAGSYELIAEDLKSIKEGISKIDNKLEKVTVSLKPGITGELVLSEGFEIGGSGVQVVTTIPLAKIQYSELQEDLENIKENATRLSKLPKRLINKIMEYLLSRKR